MPSIAQMPSSSTSPSSARKRKREQRGHVEGEDHMKMTSTGYIAQTSPLADSRSLFNIERPDNIAGHSPSQQRLLLKPRSMKLSRNHDTKRQRIFLSGPELGLLDPIDYTGFLPTANSDVRAKIDSTPDLKATTTSGYTSTDLSPCHICHQKPKVRGDLDSYANCEGCGKRTCYICMRECLGPSTPADGDEGCESGRLGIYTDKDAMSFSFHVTADEALDSKRKNDDGGHVMRARDEESRMNLSWPNSEGTEWEHRGMVCSRCCVERGVDGEVKCLECLRAEEGG